MKPHDHQARRHLSDATIIAKLDALGVVFDDRNAVANGGLVLLMTLADRLGLKGLVDDGVHLGDAPGHANAGQKALALVASALVGGNWIDDAGVLRSGRAALLGTWVPAPSTLGTFLRSFSWPDARSLDKVAAELLKKAWAAGAGPGDGPLTIDVDSSICTTYGLKKQGARFGYTSVRGLHPLLATASGSGEVLGVRQRGGNAHTARGAASFLAEVFNRVRAAGASGELTLRADSGFYNHKVTGRLPEGGRALLHHGQDVRPVAQGHRGDPSRTPGRLSLIGPKVAPTWPNLATSLSARTKRCAS